MEYIFATERSNYADLASGRVFYSLPGHPAFPIRLASEIYQRCLAYLNKGRSPCTLYDPCCGAAYHLAVIAYLHWDSVFRLICSDTDAKAVQLAGRNLGLLTPAGMERRAREISAMVNLYDKASHKDALTSIQTLLQQIICLTNVRPLKTHVFQADATDPAGLAEGLQGSQIDIVFTDIPYGQHSQWVTSSTEDPAWAMLEALRSVLTLDSIVAISADKDQKIAHPGYQRIEKLKLGKRQVVISRPV
jgi:23S rRNA (guanine2535-N1)-methyltransferase